MSSPDRSAELLVIAERVVAMAAPGEQVEAYVSRGLSTEIRVYEGEVEHFVSAQSESIGIRVIRDGRTGTSSCGTLDASEIAEMAQISLILVTLLAIANLRMELLWY